ncbi:hypothetical protein [Candidatus Chloroploca sp. Khr17]|uniref:hypothetical protein n=1 Tax=Candidatus Chloroploca sp. Khr17 TaxID=2496869 RepID=UPI00101C1D85|nr:hypothetical protein [Candidatus Chloroploca sp. Khr17]
MHQPIGEPPLRTLMVASTAGLCNRLRVLLSGMALAEATGREFTMFWPRTKDCAAGFAELFANPWPVYDVTDEEWANRRHTFSRERVRYNLLTTDVPQISLWTSHSLLMPQRFPAHKDLQHRMGELLALMQPIETIIARVEAFQTEAFRTRMIGVHLRRGDFRVFEPIIADNTATAMRAVDAYLAQAPDAGILLCTDDGALNQYSGKAVPTEGVRARFVQRYGERVVATTPRSLDRREPIAIHDALVDLWLLRQTDYFVGTVGSSFSGMAVLGRSVPVTMCQLQHPLRNLLPLRYWLRGERPLKWLVRYYWKLIRPRGVR